MAMKLATPPTQGPSRGLPRTSGSLSTAALRILARPLGDSASAAISGTTFERSRMPPLESMIPGFSRPRGPKRTSFMDSPRAEGGRFCTRGRDHASGAGGGQEMRARRGQHSLSQKCVQEATHASHTCCRIATNAEILRKLGGLRSIFVCNRSLPRTGLPPCTWSARQAASDAGSGADKQWQVRSSGLRRVIWVNWGVRRGRREPASFAFGPSHGTREYAAIDEQVLPGDVAGLGGAQKGAGGAEFIRRPEALGGHGRHALAPCLLDRDAPV